ncbi:PEP-CTERM sorting domain-containing protein [Rugamonas sp.]|uniref:PEP-CTERM sorting domain-containing protein n=1 Tax=Rugamonas sp. TaxID=1926287 RepID=UPI0025D6D835|nr:PEP-CTERM sorting domain-containing protein [Rugamonas sp.]
MKKMLIPLLFSASLFSASAMADTVLLTLPGGASGGSSNGFSLSGFTSLGSTPIIFDSASLSYDAGSFDFGGLTMIGQPMNYGGSGGLGQDHSDFTVSLTFRNLGGQVMSSEAFTLSGSGSLQTYLTSVAGVHEVDISTGGRGSQLLSLEVSAVPEPETYAMLFVGLGLLGAVARARASAKPA